MVDFAMFAQMWLDTNCGQCDGYDLDCDEDIDVYDLAQLADNWLVE